MKTVIRFSYNLVVILIVSFAFVTNLNAMNSENIFQYELGISLNGNYSNEDLLTVETGTVIQGVILDPTKMGGCEHGDPVKVTNIEADIWHIEHLKTGHLIIVKTVLEQETLKTKQIGSSESLSYEKDYLKSNNVIIKLGPYLPNNDMEDLNIGFYSQVTYNRYVNKNFAFEIGGGYFLTTGAGDFKNSSGHKVRLSGNLHVYNTIVNLKAVFPMPFGEVYAGVGPGLYWIYGYQTGSSFIVDDHDTVFGGQAIAGINFNINEVLFLGFEGQYIFTDKAELSDGNYSKSFNMNGYNISGVIGFRF